VAGVGAVGERVGTTTRSSTTATCTSGTATGGEAIDRVIRATVRVIQDIVQVLQVIVRGTLRIGQATLATMPDRGHRQTRLARRLMFLRGRHRIHRQVARTVRSMMASARPPHRDPITQQRKLAQTAEISAGTQSQAKVLRNHVATPFRDQEVGVRKVLAGNKAWDPGPAQEGELNKQ
jgi:hypothetical protein